MELNCAVQKYAWGKIGLESQVAQLARNKPNFDIDTNSPYAELWMGTHPNGPSTISVSGQSLEEYIKAHPNVLGDSCRSKFGDNLPFLFKILSVNKALSIQAHPNIELATRLHHERPEIYKDANHKPEMAIALTEFEGLCGFRPLTEIQKHFEEITQLQEVVGEDEVKVLLKSNNESYSDALKASFTRLMQCDKDIIATKFNELTEAIKNKKEKSDLDELFLRLGEQYPKDVGCFVIYYLNVVRLTPGEAMFLGPNVPHAYLSGDCVECMACSDNVVRAGLTPKLIDVEVLCSMLHYKCTEGSQSVKFPCHSEDLCSVLYEAPVPDFSVAKLLINDQYKLNPRDSASILICVAGSGTYVVNGKNSDDGHSSRRIEPGTILFLGTMETCEVKAENENIICYQAFC